GTSADGIDVAVIQYNKDSSTPAELIDFSEYPMPEKLREPILRLAAPGINEIDSMGELDRALGQAYAEAVQATIREAGLNHNHIAAIGCHGQTIRHRPKTNHPFTMQIGCAATLTERTGITAVSDFRSRDIAAGGEGAPLVPFAHRQLFASSTKNTAVLNLGGIANITWLGAAGGLSGFDTGPGNMIMDGLMLDISDGRHAYDENGELAASGTACQSLLEQLMHHPFLQRRPPKSTGREEFGEAVIDTIIHWPDISDADRLATACQFTANSVADSIAFLPAKPDAWLVCGGGVKNRHLMQLLAEQLSPASVASTEKRNIPPQAVESMCFAMLARQTLMGQPNTLAAVTGANHDICGGQITPGNNWSALLQSIPTWIR
ncbi:MAG: anhydro-N-acetylmuramic acid kinase, partial [Mariprofundus sp.]